MASIQKMIQRLYAAYYIIQWLQKNHLVKHDYAQDLLDNINDKCGELGKMADAMKDDDDLFKSFRMHFKNSEKIK